MRIAIISDLKNWEWAGCEELWAALAASALRRGNRVAAFLSRASVSRQKVDPLVAMGLEVNLGHNPSQLVQRIRRWSWRLENVTSRLLPVFASLENFAPDVLLVNCGDAIPTALFLRELEVVRALRLPYVVICHNSYLFDKPTEGRHRDATIRYYLGARQVCFVAERTRREVEHLLGTGLPSVRIVRNPVNMTDIAPILMPDVSDVRIASIGRLAINSKGQDILLGALGAPEFKDKVWKLSVYGGGPHLEHLKRLAHHYGIADRVEFRGYVDDIRAIWKEHQLLALSSRVESAPLVVVEAMLCARPCVVNNVGGVTEWITEPETGFVSEGQHIDSFRMALGRAWLRKCDWASIGTRARDIALKLIDPDPGSTLLEILLKVVRGE